MAKQRKHYTPEEKVAILRRHLLEKEPISELCDELGLQPTVFYRWQKEFFENGAAAFREKRPTNQPSRSESRTWRRRSRPKKGNSGFLVGRRSVLHGKMGGHARPTAVHRDFGNQGALVRGSSGTEVERWGSSRSSGTPGG
jgi:transposase